MCNNGVNRSQLQMSIEMAQQQTALVSGWMKEINHLAGHAELAGEELAAAEAALKTARRALEDAVDLVSAAPAAVNYEVQSV